MDCLQRMGQQSQAHVSRSNAREGQARTNTEDASCRQALAKWQENRRPAMPDIRAMTQVPNPRSEIPLRTQDAATWCRDLADVARCHGWHSNDALFLQIGRFCAYVRGAGHRKLLHPVVLAPKQDFLSFVPIVCPPSHLTYVDAQAVTDAVALDPAVNRIISGIYRFANACEQVRSRSLPPAPLPEVGLDEAETRALEESIGRKVQRLQDLADSTTRMLSAVFNGVSSSLLMDGPVAEITAAVEDLVGKRVADTALPLTPPDVPWKPEGETPPLGESPVSTPASDPVRDIWNDVAAIRELAQTRLPAAEKQRRLSVAAEALQSHTIRVVENALPAAGTQNAAVDLDPFSEAVVALVNFRRVREAVADIRAALPVVLDQEKLGAEADAIERALAETVGTDRAAALRAQVARAVEGERAIDRAVDRVLDAGVSVGDVSEPFACLRNRAVEMLGEEEAGRLLAPLRESLQVPPEEINRQAVRDHGIGLLLALSSRGERELERLFTAGELSEEDAWRIQDLHRVLVGANIATCLSEAVERLERQLAAEPVSNEAVLADKQVVWGLAYEILNWEETRRVAEVVARNAQAYTPAQGTFAELRLADGQSLLEVAAGAVGLSQALDAGIPTVAEAPLLVSAAGELLVPGRTRKVIGGVTEIGGFRLSRQVTRWNQAEVAELLACSDSPYWVVFSNAAGAMLPTPGAVVDALACRDAVKGAGGSAEVWCGVVCHPSGGEERATLHAFRPDPDRAEEIRAAASKCEAVLAEFSTALDARLDEVEAQLRATGYVPAKMIACYRAAAPAIKDVLRQFSREHLPALGGDRYSRLAHEEIDAFARFAVRALTDAQRQGARRQGGQRPLIGALYTIDDHRANLRNGLLMIAREAACEAHLIATELLQPVAVEVVYEAGQRTDTLPLHPQAIADARMDAFVAMCAGPDADAEQKRRVHALCDLAGKLFESDGEPGPGAALLLEFLGPLREPLFAHERHQRVLAPEVFDGFLRVLENRRADLGRYLVQRPAAADTADAILLALLVRGMEGRRAAHMPLWEPLAEVLRGAGDVCGQRVTDLIHLSDTEEALRLIERVRSGELAADTRLVSRLSDDARKELGLDLASAAPETLALVRDDLLALLRRNLVRLCERLQPERDRFLSLAAGTLSAEERRELVAEARGESKGGKRQKRRPSGVPTGEPTAEEIEALRARLAESARRFAEYEHLVAVLEPYAGDTTGALYPFALAVLADRSAEIVRPALSAMPSLTQLLADSDAGEGARGVDAPPLAEDAVPAEESVPAADDGPVGQFLAEFGHLGSDALATDLVEAALVLFPNEGHVRKTLGGNRKQVLDAILAQEYPTVLRSARMQIVVAAEPRGLRLHHISDLVKMVSEGGATPAEVRDLLRSL